MSRFHFDEAVMSAGASELNNAAGNIVSCSMQVRTAVASIASASGFSIGDIVSDINFEVTKLAGCSDALLEGEKSIRKIIDAVKNYERKAVSFKTADKSGNYEFEGGVCAPKGDNSKSGEMNDTDCVHKEDEYTVNDIGVRKGIKIYNYWGKERAVMTDDSGNYFIRKTNGDFYDGYSQQDEQNWNYCEGKKWVDPSQECTSAALATSSTINGIDKSPDDYNDYNGITKIGGYSVSSEQLTDFCVDNLKNGCTTVIYYNYSGYGSFGSNGHAVTVFGAESNASSVYDLWVIDPWDGQRKKFSELSNYGGGNLYICYTTYADNDDSTYAGAATQRHHIVDYFNR